MPLGRSTRVWRRVLQEEERYPPLVTQLGQVGRLQGVPGRDGAVVGHHAHQTSDGQTPVMVSESPQMG